MGGGKKARKKKKERKKKKRDDVKLKELYNQKKNDINGNERKNK